LNETLTAEGVFDIVDYKFFPWGNAFFNTSECPYKQYSHDGIHCWLDSCGSAAKQPDADCYNGTALCQHGPDECEMNLIEACAMALHKQDVMASSEFVYCLESGKGTLSSCADYVNFDADEIQECADGPLGVRVNEYFAKATAALDPPHTFTPWILVGGK